MSPLNCLPLILLIHAEVEHHPSNQFSSGTDNKSRLQSSFGVVTHLLSHIVPSLNDDWLHPESIPFYILANGSFDYVSKLPQTYNTLI